MEQYNSLVALKWKEGLSIATMESGHQYVAAFTMKKQQLFVNSLAMLPMEVLASILK